MPCYEVKGINLKHRAGTCHSSSMKKNQCLKNKVWVKWGKDKMISVGKKQETFRDGKSQ